MATKKPAAAKAPAAKKAAPAAILGRGFGRFAQCLKK